MRHSIQRGFGLALGFALFRLAMSAIVGFALVAGVLLLIVLVAHSQEPETITVTDQYSTITYQCDWVPAGSVNAQDFPLILTGNHGWEVCQAS